MRHQLPQQTGIVFGPGNGTRIIGLLLVGLGASFDIDSHTIEHYTAHLATGYMGSLPHGAKAPIQCRVTDASDTRARPYRAERYCLMAETWRYRGQEIGSEQIVFLR